MRRALLALGIGAGALLATGCHADATGGTPATSFTPVYPATVSASTYVEPSPSYNPSAQAWLASIQADIARAQARQSAAANYNAKYAECNRAAAAAAGANPHQIGAFEDAFSACMAQP